MLRRSYLLILLCPLVIFASLNVHVKSPHVILMNYKTKRVLFEKGASQKVYPASTTKIATALWILQKTRGLDLGQTMCTASLNALKVMPDYVKKARNFQIPPYLLEPDGTTCYIKIGEKLSLKTLMHGMLLSSGNDASNVIADSFEQNIDLFMLEMNIFLRKLGIMNTNFVNPHGLHHPDHYTTAHDMALIASYSLQEELFREMVFCKEFVRPKSNLSSQSLFIQGNQLVKKGASFYYDKAYGLKTGRTRAAGFNLVAAAKHEDRDLIAVVHKARDSATRYMDAIDLFNAAFNEKKVERRLFNKNDTQFSLQLKGANKTLQAVLKRDIDFKYYPSEIKDVTAKVNYDKLVLPIEKGKRVGSLKIYDQEGLYLEKHTLYAKQRVSKTLFAKTLYLLTSFKFYAIFCLVIVLIFCSTSLGKKRL
jgi:serine-type D-Ala-D-Ala carboxypeptidase (penicillin-binding protein 5/6)